MVMLRFVRRLLGLASMVILARLLAPGDFGLIALATVIAGSLELLGAFNFQLWLIRHPAPVREHYDTLWSLSIIRGTVTAILLILLSYPASVFFEEPRLSHVMLVLALVSFAGGFSNAGVVDFQKHLEFDKDFRFLLSTRLGSFLVSVGLAVWLRDYRALLGGLIADTLLTLVLSFGMHAFRPRWSLKYWREAFDFSKWLLVGNFFSFFYDRSDNLILGKLTSTGALGLYTLAHEIASLASTELVVPIRRVLIPGYAKLLGESGMLRQAFVDGFAIILLVGLPAAAGIGLLADPLVRTAVGTQWVDAIPILQVLAIYGMTSVAAANLGPIIIARGYTRAIAALGAVGLAILLPAFIWACSAFGVIGGAWAVALTHLAVFAMMLAVTLRIVRMSVVPLLGRIWRTIVATLVMSLAVLMAQEGVTGTIAPLQLLVSFAIGVISYAGTVTTLWVICDRPAGAESTVFDYCRVRLAR